MPKPFQYKTGSLIYPRGEKDPDKIFILQNGKVSLVYEVIETGDDMRDQVQPGEFFGVKSALGCFPREENAIAMEDSTLMAFTVPEFELYALSNTGIIMKMLTVFSNQMRRIHEQISSLLETGEENPDEGLFGLGEKLIKRKRYSHAKYVFGRYLELYPAGKLAARARKNLQIADTSLADNAAAHADGKNQNCGAIRGAMQNRGAPESAANKPGSTKAYNGASDLIARDETEGNISSFARFTRTFQADEIIFCEHEPGDTFYMIQSGRVKLIKNTGEFERTLDILQPLEMFGEMAILENSPRTATAIALDEVTVLELNSQNFEILMHGNPQLAFKLLRIFSKRIYDSKRRFMILTLPDTRSKVAMVFMILDETQTDIDKSGNNREFLTTVDDIAQWAGISVRETRETLAHFAAQNRLEYSPSRIIVKNINDFSRLVNSRRNQV
jgi:CRP-like cAMP-binding protein